MTEKQDTLIVRLWSLANNWRLFRYVRQSVLGSRPEPTHMDAIALAKFPEENPNPVLRVTSDGTVIFANQASAGLLAAWGCAVGQHLPDAWQQRILMALAQASPMEVETAVGDRLFSLSFAPLPAEQYVNIYGYDVTKRRQAEDQLAYKALILASVHDAVIGTDESLKVTYWNAAAEEMFGWTEQEALGRETAQLFKTRIHGSSREAALQLLMSQGFYDGEVFYVRKDGAEIHTHARSTVLRSADGAFAGSVTTIRDITAQMQAEEALRFSEERFAKAFQASPVAIVITREVDAQIVDVNEAWSKLLGYTRTQAIGHTPMELNIFTKDMREQVINLLKKSGQIQNMEAAIADNMGKLHTILFSMDMLYIQDEPHILSIFTDITEHKRAQQQEVELILERERIELLTNFIQNAAHEFKTPLATINTLAYVMARLSEAEKRQSKSVVIHEQVQRINKLVNMLLMMSRIESEVMTQLAPVDVSALVEAVFQKAVNLYGLQPVLRFTCDPALPLVSGNPDLLEEAFWQILDNAFSHTPVEGVIHVTVAAISGHIHLAVCDSGTGISAADLPYIFQTFWRQDKAHTLPGFGLGLPIAQKIVERHNGRIEVTSDEGVGTTATIILPVAP